MSAVRRRAVFLDRDGVLNELVPRGAVLSSPRRLAEFRLVPEAAEAVRQLHQSGFLALVVTNQPEVARGLMAEADLAAMTERLGTAVGVDDVAVCPHDDGDGCGCRKPAPGLLLRLAEQWKVDLPGSFMVGDTWRDVAAGRAAGCRTVLIGGASDAPGVADLVVADLREAAQLISTLG